MISHTVTFDDQLVTFCKGDSFRSYVRQSINDELFWRDCVNRLNLADKIDNSLNSKLPRMVKDEIDRIFPSIFENKINSYILQQFPANIAKELQSQLPAFLSNNSQMQDILQKHKFTLENELETKASEILTTIVDDPSHHVLTQSHLDSIDRKGTNAVVNFNTDARTCFDEQMKSINNKVANDLKQLHTSLAEINNLNAQIVRLRTELTKHTNEYQMQMTGMKIVLVGLFSGIVLVTAMALSK